MCGGDHRVTFIAPHSGAGHSKWLLPRAVCRCACFANFAVGGRSRWAAHFRGTLQAGGRQGLLLSRQHAIQQRFRSSHPSASAASMPKGLPLQMSDSPCRPSAAAGATHAARQLTAGGPGLRPTGLTVAVMTRADASRHSTSAREPAHTQGTHTLWMELVRSQHT